MILTASDTETILADALSDLSDIHRDILTSHFNTQGKRNETRKKYGLTRSIRLGKVHDEYDDALFDALNLLRQAMRSRGIQRWSDLPGM